jgi:gliding motility associated protien GldN
MVAIAPLFPQENARWSRVIYRQLDLTKETNAPLYYMKTTSGEQSSLFTMLFQLLQDDAIPAYEYLDGQERFTDEYRIDFKEFLERFSIYYQEDNGKITVNDADIPSHEVLAYFLKEVYYFDSQTSNFMVRPLALCPVLVRRDDLDNVATRYPLFWVPYAELEPHTRKMPVMASSLNNSVNGTVDDFFRLRKYDGEIYKAGNPRNLAIAQYTSTLEEMKAEQERIEKELKDFEKGLWTDEDELIPAGQPTDRRNTKTRVSRRNRRPASHSPGSSSVTMRDRRY